MSEKYIKTDETESTLFNRRIKLIELIILTITALIIMMSFVKRIFFIWPISILGVDLVFLLCVILFGANKSIQETNFSDDIHIIKKDISYKLNWQDKIGFVIYIISIIVLISLLIIYRSAFF